jgi:hypothetical protein
MGRAGSQGPWISFLYLCNPMSHQLVIPMARHVRIPPRIAPPTPAFQPRPVIVTQSPPPAPRTINAVNAKCPVQDECRTCRLKTGNSPNTSILKSVKLNTSFVYFSREARTVDAIRAAFVDREAGNLAKFVSKRST